MANSPIAWISQKKLPEKVLVEDGPTLTHGDMAYGAGVIAAENWGGELIDPRPMR